jgi:hypothetical protein
VPAGAIVALAGASAVFAGAAAVLVDPSTGVLVVGASAPATGACSTASSTARGDGGEGFHLSGGRPLSLSSSSSSFDDEFAGIVGGRVLAAHAADTPRSAAPDALAA